MNLNSTVLEPLIFRVPLHSIPTIQTLLDETQQKPLDQVLMAFFAGPTMQKALYLASPSLWNQYQQAQQQQRPLSEAAQRALFKYATRSGIRSTPFGLFAGLALGTTGTQTEFTFAENRLKPTQKLDSSAQVQFINQLLQKKEFQRQLCYRVNDSHYIIHQQVRYSEFTDQGYFREVQISSIPFDELIKYVIEFTSSFQPFTAIVEKLIHLTGADVIEVTDYVHELIAIKFLISEAEPRVTGKPYSQFLKTLNRRIQDPELSEFIEADNSSKHKLAKLSQLIEIDDWLKQQGFTTANQQSFWQTDLHYKVKSATIQHTLLKKLAVQIDRVSPLLVNRPPVWIDQFVRRFTERYGECSVPLLHVLDNESGIGLGAENQYLANPAPLLTGLLPVLTAKQLEQTASNGQPASDSLSTLRSLLYRRGQYNQSMEVVIPEEAVPTSGGRLPSLGVVWGSLLRNCSQSTQKLDDYHFFLTSILPNASALLGRFSQDNADIAELIYKLHQREDSLSPEVIYAEIVHLAGSRSGNVNIRATLRPFEIYYLTSPSVEQAGQIALSELDVRIVGGQRIQLYCPRLGKEIIPRLSTAHNVQQGDEVYQFLAGLYYQQPLGGRWDWAEYSQQPFLPRLRYQQLILSRAQWTITIQDLTTTTDPIAGWEQFRTFYRVPRYILIQESDNELFIDTQNSTSLSILLSEVQRRKKVRFVEWIHSPETSWVQDEAGSPFAHELLFFMESAASKLNRLPVLSSRIDPSVCRTFPPGSAWVYLKLYTGHDQLEHVLVEYVVQFLEKYKETNCTHWFFIRYYDPQFHLRIRFCVPQSTQRPLFIEALSALGARLMEESFVYKVQFDTYERELERYGYATIETCEKYFHLDTLAIVAFLRDNQHASEAQRIEFAMLNALCMLNDFGLSDADKLAFFRERQESYWQENGRTKDVRDYLNRVYRQCHSSYEGIISFLDGNPVDLAGLRDLQRRSEQSQPLVDALHISPEACFPTSLKGLIRSLLHMSLARLFQSQLRLYELITYHLLCRLYESWYARSRKTN